MGQGIPRKGHHNPKYFDKAESLTSAEGYAAMTKQASMPRGGRLPHAEWAELGLTVYAVG